MAGIKGQKWGIRRFQNEDGSLTPEGRIRYHRTDEKIKKQIREKGESSTWKSKDARHLDDNELNRRNSRLQREQQYRNMTKSRGRKAAEWIGKTAGAILVASLVGVAKGKMSGVYRGTMDKYGAKAGEAIKKMGRINLSNLHG